MMVYSNEGGKWRWIASVGGEYQQLKMLMEVVHVGGGKLFDGGNWDQQLGQRIRAEIVLSCEKQFHLKHLQYFR